MGYTAYCIKTMKNILKVYPEIEEYLPFRKNSLNSKWKNFTKEQIVEMANNSNSRIEFMKQMGYTTSRKDVYKEIIATYPEIKVKSHEDALWRSFTKEQLFKIASDSINETEFCKKLGYFDRATQIIQSIKNYYPDIQIKQDENKCKWKQFTKEQLQEFANTSDGFEEFYSKIGYTTKSGNGDIKKAIEQQYPDFIFPKHCLRTKGEKAIAKALKENHFSFSEQYWFKDLRGQNKAPLRFDFLVLLKDQPLIVIEYQGEQHYKSIKFFKSSLEQYQERDNLKRQYCEEHDIIMIEIPYWDLNKINKDYIKEKINEYCN